MADSVVRDTKYRGISRFRGRWVAQIRAGSKNFYLGSFATETQAARAWDAAVYWLDDALAPMRERKKTEKGEFPRPKFFDYNFPDDATDANPPIINARLREIMTELRVKIPEGAPTETPFIDIFHEVMGHWFAEHPAATCFDDTATELYQLFKYAISGTVRQLGIKLRDVPGIQYRKSNGRSLIVIGRGAVVGTSAPVKNRLDRASYRQILTAFKRLYRRETPDNFNTVYRLFTTWHAASAPLICPPNDNITSA